MNEVVTTDANQVVDPFAKLRDIKGLNSGAVAIESERAIAEAQGQLILAKKFPRSVSAAIGEFLDSCKSLDFAQVAFYAVPNRGNGPSIRFAEEAARCYGNFDYGHRELSRTDDKSEVEVFAWDKEKNNRSIRQITVFHVLDTKNGSRKLTDQADIDNKIANVASKQMRGRILALMPKHLVAMGIAEAKRTLAGGTTKPMGERIIGMQQAFGAFGVTTSMLELNLGHKLDDTTIDELANLTGIYNSIRDGAKPSDYFKAEELEKPAAAAASVAAIADAAKKGAATKTAEKAAAAKASAEKAAAEKLAAEKASADSAPAADTSTATTADANQNQSSKAEEPGATTSAGADDVF